MSRVADFYEASCVDDLYEGGEGRGLGGVVLHERFLLGTVVLAAVHADERAVLVELHWVRVFVLGEAVRLALQRLVLALDRALTLLVLWLVAARNRNNILFLFKSVIFSLNLGLELYFLLHVICVIYPYKPMTLNTQKWSL